MPNDVLAVGSVLKLPAVDSDDLLGLLQVVLQLGHLGADVVARGAVTEGDVFVEADEAGGVTEVAAQDVAHGFGELKHLFVVVDPEHGRDVVSAAVVEGELEGGETADVLFGADLNLGEQPALERFLGGQGQGFCRKHVPKLRKPWVLEL